MGRYKYIHIGENLERTEIFKRSIIKKKLIYDEMNDKSTFALVVLTKYHIPEELPLLSLINRSSYLMFSLRLMVNTLRNKSKIRRFSKTFAIKLQKRLDKSLNEINYVNTHEI
jgi:hypothetical protein